MDHLLYPGHTHYLPFLAKCNQDVSHRNQSRRSRHVLAIGLMIFVAATFLLLHHSFFLGSAPLPMMAISYGKMSKEEMEQRDITSWSEDDFIRAFDTFVMAYGKTYVSHEERSWRLKIFKKNLIYIHVSNQQNQPFQLGMNAFGDMTREEFKKNYASLQPSNNSTRVTDRSLASVNASSLPAAIDWRDFGCVSEVKDQKKCGSCWAFSTTGAVEGASCVKYGHLTSLSEQQLVDCAGPEGNMACNGGEADWGFQYVIDNGGLCSERDYPYKAHPSKHCKARECVNTIAINSFKDVPPRDVNALRAAIAKHGPVSVAIEADKTTFQFYKSGVFSAHCGSQLDHAVLLVGYGTSPDGEDYFILKNSWGTGWGEGGYMKISAHGHHPSPRDAGECGLFLSPSYATSE